MHESFDAKTKTLPGTSVCLFLLIVEMKNCQDFGDITAIQGDIPSLFRPLPG